MKNIFTKLIHTRLWILAILAGTYAVSILSQCRTIEKTHPEGTRVIRISHTRLEPGYSESLNAIIADFREYKARQGVAVDVQHNAISSGYYEPWLNTQLVGGTAPDIIEQPVSKHQDSGAYNPTYFRILDQVTNQPNPFNDFERLREILGDLDLNRNAPAHARAQYPELNRPYTIANAIEEIDPIQRDLLRTQSHRNTFSDGMLGGYNFELAHYYRFIISSSQIRLAYNKDLIQQATGQPDPPKTLGEFMEMCTRIQNMTTQNNRKLIPIAASRNAPKEIFLQDTSSYQGYYGPFLWAETYRNPLALQRGLLGGSARNFLEGNWSMQTPAIKEFYGFMREFGQFLTPGYQSLDSSASMFDFIQKRAAMRITNIEEAAAIFMQADFPVGVMQLPYPAPGDRWYEFATYPRREYNFASGQFSISRHSENFDLSLEFMQFWTSRIWNERFNRFTNLVPVIKSAEPVEKLLPFLPVRKGVHGTPGISVPGIEGSPAEITRKGEEQRFLAGEIDYETFAAKAESLYRDPRLGMARSFAHKWNKHWRNAKQADMNITVHAARELLMPPESSTSGAAFDFMTFRSSIYVSGALERYNFDLIYWGDEEMPPFPEY